MEKVMGIRNIHHKCMSMKKQINDNQYSLNLLLLSGQYY